MDAMKTGGLIAQVRREKELTQRDLAERLHVSVQAVSKWERGRSCPDVGLLEPLAEALGLTVTELLSGQRGEEPKEELVRDSLRFGQDQLGPKIRRWRWLFVLAALALAGVLLWVGYVWLRDNTEVLPQRETVVAPLDKSDRERQIANAFGQSGSNLYLYEVTLAEDFTEIQLDAELWTGHGMEQSWQIMWQGSGNMGREIFGARRQVLVLSMVPHWTQEDGRWTEVRYECGVDFSYASSKGDLLSISSPYLSGGVCTGVLHEPTAVDPESGLVLIRASLGGPDSAVYAPGGGFREETVELVVRMYCK